MQALASLFLIAAIVYLVILGALYVGQRNLLFLPDRSSYEQFPLSAAGFEPLHVSTEDGLDITHLLRPPPGDGRPLIVLFHGNAGQAAHRMDKFDYLDGQEVAVAIAGYRGYGGNPGKPSEAGLLIDGRSLLQQLEALGFRPGQWVLYGESLGTGVAVKLAAEWARAGRPVGGVIIESGYTSIAEVAQHHYWYVPARQLLKDRFDIRDEVGAIAAPLLMVHAVQDRVVPIEFGRRLFELADEPKRFLAVEGSHHNNIFSHPAVVEAVQDFVFENRQAAE